MGRMKQVHAPEELSDRNRIYAFWCRIPSLPNFGDALTPWLIRQITGKYPIFLRPEDPRPKYFVSGSIMSYAGPEAVVWGSGIMRRDDPISPQARLLAVRGPLTRARALECNASCPAIYGDPALLLPKLYDPPIGQRQGIGLIAHFSDKPSLQGSISTKGGLRLIDIQDTVESVIDQIVSCEFVASSSLHGLIASHAYGIPAVWVKFRDLPSGDDSKFCDYLLSIGQEASPPVVMDYAQIDVRELTRRVKPMSMSLDIEPLWNACPFRD
jgi:pyruvyltransferase